MSLMWADFPFWILYPDVWAQGKNLESMEEHGRRGRSSMIYNNRGATPKVRVTRSINILEAVKYTGTQGAWKKTAKKKSEFDLPSKDEG